MFSIGQELYLESELKRVKLAQLPIVVKYLEGEIADYGGPIQELNEHSVRVNDMYYTKAACRFYIR
ncbi:hypothetical protein [Paenibacillus sp. CF384]|uniref:hypothetical protein n=1 Tax=Paenibacillus sp. CF384 TaxID=1884382 RepID=UPI000899B596|nr:hypothetical protein [Paenibacillus sp. CF384]SDW79797.1 hypothetical protein SAMN05518855_1005149 [Paenibacillus sp. CF384]